jgi:hypothetical protein
LSRSVADGRQVALRVDENLLEAATTLATSSIVISAHRNDHDEAPLLDGAVFSCSTGNGLMTQKFDPAPKDKHAVDPKNAIKADKSKTNLKEGLEESFPGSDPASATQPKKSKDA